MKGKNVLIVPLNWGLGHATRIVPIIRLLTDQGATITISGSPAQLKVLTDEFKNITIVQLPFLTIKFRKFNNHPLYLLLQVLYFFFQIIREHNALNRLLKKQHFDLIISDNCYGLWNKNVSSILITHQLNIKVPISIRFLNPLIKLVNHKLIRNFNYCWVPDLEGSLNLSGALSHPVPKPLNIKYIGILSRFDENIIYKSDNKTGDIKNLLFIISGPEVQRSIFESVLETETEHLKENYNCTFIRGLPDKNTKNLPTGWYNHLATTEMKKKIIQADLVICRSGYSTIMDLVSLKKTALLIPTPGQTEQEYLAGYLDSAELFYYQDQNNIDILKGIKMIEKSETHIKKFPGRNDYKIIEEELKKIFSGTHK